MQYRGLRRSGTENPFKAGRPPASDVAIAGISRRWSKGRCTNDGLRNDAVMWQKTGVSRCETVLHNQTSSQQVSVTPVSTIPLCFQLQALMLHALRTTVQRSLTGFSVPLRLRPQIPVRSQSLRVGVFLSRLAACHSIAVLQFSVLSPCSQAVLTWTRCARHHRSSRWCRRRSDVRFYLFQQWSLWIYRACRPATDVSRLIPT